MQCDSTALNIYMSQESCPPKRKLIISFAVKHGAAPDEAMENTRLKDLACYC